MVSAASTRNNIDPDLIEPVLSERTRAIIPVHLFGLPADLAPILDLAKRRGFAVVEDAAAAQTYVGTISSGMTTASSSETARKNGWQGFTFIEIKEWGQH